MKNRNLIYLLLTASALVLAACSDDDHDRYDGWTTSAASGSGSGSSSSASTSFDVPDIEFDETPLDEGTEIIPTDDNDYVENSSFSNVIYIDYDGQSVTTSGDLDKVTLTTDGAHVTVTATSKMAYVLSGESNNGSFKVYSENKMMITLNGLSLANPNGAAINDQCGKSLYIVIADDTDNTLSDGSPYSIPDNEDMKGTIFSEGQIIFSGNGNLTVNATGNNGIASDDYIIFRPGNVINVTSSANNGVKSNDGVTIHGGVLNIGVSAAAAKGINSEATVTIDGGRTTIITSGAPQTEGGETTGAAGIKSDSLFTMTDGELNILSSGQGGKGINCDTDIEISGGEVNVVTTGKEYSGGDGCSPKGIRAENNITISGGEINVTCSGGDDAEGIESKNIMTIEGGEIVVNAYDDAINAASRINIYGGKLYAYSADNDGIDSNGSMYITDGVILAIGTTTPEGPFDCDNNVFSITGGTIIGIGGTTSTPSTSSTTQPVILLGQQSYTSGKYLTLDDDDDANLFAFLLPRTYSSAVLMVSTPDMTEGETYTFKTGASVSGGSWWQGYSDDTTTSGGTTIKSVSLSSTIVSSGTSSGNQGGNGGAGGNGGGFGGGWW